MAATSLEGMKEENKLDLISKNTIELNTLG